jgi:lipoate-protein ligase B
VSESRECLVVWLGCVSYSKALALQMRICNLIKRGFNRDVLLLLEHPPTITLGRSGNRSHLLVDVSVLKSRGIELWNIDRGGDITFHGPGQLIAYPILSLQPPERDVHEYMRRLEESLIRLLSCYGVASGREARFTGVWTAGGKIAAMGVHISRWVTRHGFALNVNTDLSYYNLIVPCGITGRDVTSIQKILGASLNLDEIVDKYVPIFGSIFSRTMTAISESALHRELQLFEATIEAAGDRTSFANGAICD